MKVKLTKKKIIFLIAAFIILFQTVLARRVGEKESKIFSQQKHLVKVGYVIDGDTIIVEGGKTVRYIGIDAPETNNPKKSVQCFGDEAFKKNRQLVGGKYIYMEKDISEVDRYGRLLRYIWLKEDQSTKKTTFINDYLVRQGYAHAATFPPDVKYTQQFLHAESEARGNLRGLWKSCN